MQVAAFAGLGGAHDAPCVPEVVRGGKVSTIIFICIGGNDMGAGDRRTRRGKIRAGSYGKTRPRKPKKTS